MAKPPPPKLPVEVETTVVLMRRLGPERFEVVEGTIRGVFRKTRQVENSVSMVVATESARREMRKTHAKQLETVNPMMARPS